MKNQNITCHLFPRVENIPLLQDTKVYFLVLCPKVEVIFKY